jgi:hypothetical protein
VESLARHIERRAPQVVTRSKCHKIFITGRLLILEVKATKKDEMSGVCALQVMLSLLMNSLPFLTS